MTRPTSEAGGTTALVLVGFVVLVIPAGIGLAHVSGESSTGTAAVITPTLPPTGLTPTPSSTGTSTGTPVPTTDDGGTTTDGNATSGRTLVVDGADTVVGGGDLPGGEGTCPNARYATIQNAVDDAEPGDTVAVCEGTYPESVTVDTADVTVLARGRVTVDADIRVGFVVTAPAVTIDGFAVNTTDGAGIRVAADRVVVRNNLVHSTKNGENAHDDDGIKLVSANWSVVRNNTVFGFPDDEISVGEANGTETRVNASHHNRIVDNDVSGRSGSRFVNSGIYVGVQAARSTVRNNTVTDIYYNVALQFPESIAGARAQFGVGIWADGNHTVVRNNTIERTYWGLYGSGPHIALINNTMRDITLQGAQFNNLDEHIRIEGNTVDGSLTGGIQVIVANGSADLIGNTVRNVNCEAGSSGVACGNGFSISLQRRNASARVLNNTIRNATHGIRLVHSSEESVANVEIHRNLILHSENLGIYNANSDTTDGYWPVVDATNNIWACGGPSSGLADPYTGRVANGSGDPVSAGDDPGVSNVHFDPFEIHEPESCPGSSVPPTDTPTETQTPTVTPSPTPTGTPTPPSPAGPTNGTDGTTGDGLGGTGDDGAGGTGGADAIGPEDGSGGTTAASTVTPTATSRLTSRPHLSPTAVVEPGFGFVAGFLGITLLAGVLAGRRASLRGPNTGREGSDD